MPANTSFDQTQIFDILNQGIVVLDRELCIVFWNAWMEEHSRLTRAEVFGRPIRDFFPELDSKAFFWKVNSVFKLGHFSFFAQNVHSYIFPFKSEKYLDTNHDYMQQSVSLAPLRDDQGRVSHVCVQVADETDTVLARERMEEARCQLEEMTRLDPLTGLANRRHLMESLSRELSRCGRSGSQVTVAILDLDHFKVVNDTYGHLCGDQVLIHTAKRLESMLRQYDLVGRYGGEEFCVILPETSLKSGFEIVERLRKAVAATPVPYEDLEIPLTVSAGCACTEDMECLSTDALLLSADQYLYKAKDAGRDCVQCSLS
ncbi:sensor domain-containing diguanylate cyclase [Desulfohalobium retbaense]|uniref:diguanylate cyclase n=1 Tax=Desulfohalobium retbaense (strain ATCC 49708 / DSM 5692 / JCM 16813 / HR100) TaxID=485915 RepID=C8X2T0_DESRD|nr:GGDEF domain-containing protein [Desulfohalobium retbaense]ACV68727.1 diguanylate cyclase with PAS/PAC sensor [Desulfohalobium retbaense DSM 5692]